MQAHKQNLWAISIRKCDQEHFENYGKIFFKNQQNMLGLLRSQSILKNEKFKNNLLLIHSVAIGL